MTATDGRTARRVTVLGPALVAAVAYVDPGNVAANLRAGSQYGYALVWVLVAANLMALIMQYLSAKLGLVTGRSLAALVSDRLSATKSGRAGRGLYAIQAVLVAMATDLAEVVGGAIALNLLFGIPLWVGGLLVGAITILMLGALRTGGARPLEVGVTAFLALTAVGFIGMLFWTNPDPLRFAAGWVPRVPDTAAWTLIAAMLGATVMPHAIYVHSSLALDHYRKDLQPARLHRLLRLQWLDVGVALLIAGSVNIALLVLGASALPNVASDEIESAHAQVQSILGAGAGVVFALALLASGLGSAIVGTHAGAGILKDLTGLQLSPVVRRTLTLVPAAALLAAPLPPTQLLILSQIVLSFGIAFAAIPLVRYTSDSAIMGVHASGRALKTAGWVVSGLIVALNVVVLVTVFIPSP